MFEDDIVVAAFHPNSFAKITKVDTHGKNGIF